MSGTEPFRICCLANVLELEVVQRRFCPEEYLKQGLKRRKRLGSLVAVVHTEEAYVSEKICILLVKDEII